MTICTAVYLHTTIIDKNRRVGYYSKYMATDKMCYVNKVNIHSLLKMSTIWKKWDDFSCVCVCANSVATQ